MRDELFNQGLDLMIFGMGTVFFFLAILVFTTAVMSNIILKYFPEAAPMTASKTDNESHLLAILQAAVDHHRTR